MKSGSHERREPFEPHTKQSLRLWLRLLNTTTVVEKSIRSYLKSNCDSTLPRFDVLAALDRADGPLTMTELSNKLLVSNGNVTGVIARLVDDGFVARKTDAADRRTQRVSLTPSGKRHFAANAKKHEALVDGIFSDVSDVEMEQLLRLVTDLNRSVHRKLDDVSD